MSGNKLVHKIMDLGKCSTKKLKKLSFDPLGWTPLPPELALGILKKCNPFFSMEIFVFSFSFHFLHSPTIHSLKTVLYLRSFEAFNDGMYSTNMVSFYCSPGIQQPRCYIHGVEKISKLFFLLTHPPSFLVKSQLFIFLTLPLIHLNICPTWRYGKS